MIVRFEDVLVRVREQRMLPTVKNRNINWTGQYLRRDCLLLGAIEVFVPAKSGRRYQMLDDITGPQAGYQRMKRKAQDSEAWRTMQSETSTRHIR